MRNNKGQFIKGGGEGFKIGHKTNIGRKASLETKEKFRQRMIGNKYTLGFKHSLKTRELISKIFKGKKKSEDWKRKISKIRIERGLSKKDKNPGWKGGIYVNNYSVDWTKTLKRSICERDDYICQICSRYGYVVHHIDYNKENCNPVNLITLCRNCHSKTNHHRDYWINYFDEKI